MKNLILIILALFLSNIVTAQEKKDSVVYVTNCLNKLNSNYLIDGIKLKYNDTVLVNQFENELGIKEYRFRRDILSKLTYGDFAKEGVFVKYTDFIYVVNKSILTTKKEKKKFWEDTSPAIIESIERISKVDAQKKFSDKIKQDVIKVHLK